MKCIYGDATVNVKPGNCSKVIDGKRCNVAFTGPPNQKYCPEHSSHIRYTGKADAK